MNAFRNAGSGRISRDRPIHFRFNGKALQGFEGDTLASALLANGVHFVARPFKYHRPRGILSAGSEEPNALVTIDRGEGGFDSNVRATSVELYESLNAFSQNCWPSLGADLGAMNDMLHPLFAAGFYYKTFMWPRAFWRNVYEPLIRGAAGLGRAPAEADPDFYVSQYAHCDVLIVGAGPAGISAALAAAASGAKVMLVDEQSELGGSLLSETAIIDGVPATAWLQEALRTLADLPNVTMLPRTTAFGYYHQNFLGLCERLADHLANPPDPMPRQWLWRVRARDVILAQGAIERPLVFAGNDRPGVMLAGAARTYLNRYGVCVGARIVVATAHDAAWQTAFELVDAGVDVAAIVDSRAKVEPGLAEGAQRRGLCVFLSASITAAQGRRRVRRVHFVAKDGMEHSIQCDTVLMSGGWTPSVHLFSHAMGKLEWCDDLGAYIPGAIRERCRSVGACAGVFGLAAALETGAQAGTAAIGCNFEIPSFNVGGDSLWTGEAAPLAAAKGRAFVDFQNDVTAKDIRLAVREGFRSVEHIKRYTTTGMATDQGKTSNLNSLAISAEALGKSALGIGLTTFRPPYTPTTFGALAGFSRGVTFKVTRKTPIDPWAEAQGAVFEPVALWRRARYFPDVGEDMHAAVARECRTVRSAVGMFDASTLGKIEVVGSDAAEFLNRMYINAWTKLAPGRCRYGVLLGEDGFILDDGVVARLAADRFHVTTTTGGAPRVLAMMEDYLQTEWPDLKVWLTSTTEQWGVIAINGPKAKTLIEPFIEGIDLQDEAFPHMAYSEGTIDGAPLRLFRVSFTGERGYELNVPSSDVLRIWEKLYVAGRDLGATVYGTEAMHVLRAEKGYIIVGQDTDGTVTPDDAGLSWAIGKTKRDFVGMRSLARPDMSKSDRLQLVGLLTEDAGFVLEEGAQVIEIQSGAALGHVTSSYWSEALGRSIALALVAGGRARTDGMVRVLAGGPAQDARVVDTVFYDHKGGRLNAHAA